MKGQKQEGRDGRRAGIREGREGSRDGREGRRKGRENIATVVT